MAHRGAGGVAYNIFAFGLPLDAYVFSFMPIEPRLPLIAAIACGTLPYFIADEWMTHGAGARRGAYALAKFCFLLSLAVAVALNLHEAVLPDHHRAGNPAVVPGVRPDQQLELRATTPSAAGRAGQRRGVRLGDRRDVSDDRAVTSSWQSHRR